MLTQFKKDFRRFHTASSLSRYEEQYFGNDLGDREFGLYEGTIDEMGRYLICDLIDFIGCKIGEMICKRRGHIAEIFEYADENSASCEWFCPRCHNGGVHHYY
jgi:hypothetical protein